MSVVKSRPSGSRKRLAFQGTPGNLGRQGSLASFMQRFATNAKAVPIGPSQSHKISHTKAPSQDPDLHHSTELRRCLMRNRSWTDIYSHPVEGRHSAVLSESKDPGALNLLLNTRLKEVANPADAREVLSAFQQTFEDVIEEIPSHSLVLRRVKSGYEDCFGKLLAKRTSESVFKQQLSDMQEMLDLQQVEKETLLDTVMQLRREVTALNSRVLRKASKIASLEKTITELSSDGFRLDQADLETQKVKSSVVKPVRKGKKSVSLLSKGQVPRLDLPPAASFDMLSPIFADSEAFVSDKEASRAEIKESLQPFPIK